MIKEKRRRQRRLKKFLIGLLVFLLVSVISYFIVVKVFVVKNVKVEGNKLYEEQLIKDTVLNDEYSWNSLYVLLKYTFIDTQEIPFIDTMEVKMNSPSTLTIKVYEKGMMGYLHISSIDQMAYFDKDGLVVETSTRRIENVPKIEGITCEEVVLFEKLPIGEQQLRDMLTLTQTLKRENLVPDSIHFGLDVSPVLYYDNTAVWLGSMELLTQKIDRLYEIMPNIEDVEGVLHMESWTEETSNIIFEKAVQDPEEDSVEDADGTTEGGDETGQETDGTTSGGGESGREADGTTEGGEEAGQGTDGTSEDGDESDQGAEGEDETGQETGGTAEDGDESG